METSKSAGKFHSCPHSCIQRQKQCFLCLPGEIRNLIYHFVVVDKVVVTEPKHPTLYQSYPLVWKPKTHKYRWSPPKYAYGEAALVQVCKSVKNELRPLIYAKTILCCLYRMNIQKQINEIHKILKYKSTKYCHIQHVAIEVYEYPTNTTLAGFAQMIAPLVDQFQTVTFGKHVDWDRLTVYNEIPDQNEGQTPEASTAKPLFRLLHPYPECKKLKEMWCEMVEE